MGNVEKTHNRMPGTSTDDYMGVEVDTDGLVKLTMDLGAGPTVIKSNTPVTYGQWHQLEIDRRGYFVTMVVRSEDSNSTIIEGKICFVFIFRQPIFRFYNLNYLSTDIISFGK